MQPRSRLRCWWRRRWRWPDRDDPALMQFKLPSKEAHHEFEQLGFNMDHSVEPAGGGAILVSAWVTDEEKALAEAHGYPAVGSSTTSTTSTASARSIAASRRREGRKGPRCDKAAQSKCKSAVPRTVRAQRADFYENNTSRFISIEANTTEAQIPARAERQTCSYTGPTLRAAWYDAQNNLHGRGQPDDLHRHRHQPGLLPVPLPGLPARRQGRRRAGPGVRQGSPRRTATSTRIDAKEWIAKNPPGYATSFKRDFITRYYNGPEAYQKMRDLAAEFVEHLPGLQAAGAEHGLPAQGPDDARLPAGVLRHLRRRQPAGRRHGGPVDRQCATAPSC